MATYTVTASDNLSIKSPSEVPPGPGYSYEDNSDLFVALQDAATVRVSRRYVSSTDPLGYAEETLHAAIAVYATDAISFSDLAAQSKPAEDTLFFFETVSSFFGQYATDTLTLSESASVSRISNQAAADTVTFNDVSHRTQEKDKLADQQDESIPQRLIQPISFVSGVLFEYPIRAPTRTLSLRSPELRNQENLNFRRIRRRTRGGQLQIYRRDIWPKWIRMRMTFIALTDANRRDLFLLFKESLGQNIGFTDWESRHWEGIITTPQTAIEQTGRGCNHELTLEFQGANISYLLDTEGDYLLDAEGERLYEYAS